MRMVGGRRAGGPVSRFSESAFSKSSDLNPTLSGQGLPDKCPIPAAHTLSLLRAERCIRRLLYRNKGAWVVSAPGPRTASILLNSQAGMVGGGERGEEGEETSI